MKKQMYLAAQYLAAAGISFLEKKDDDSHTNLGFDLNNNSLKTHVLSENDDQLLLSYEEFSLIWKSNADTSTLKLDNRSHKEVIQWLEQTSQAFLNKTYAYNFHYDFPYEISDVFTYELTSTAELAELKSLRIVSQQSLEKINKAHGLNADIRIWPHHFDTGIYAPIPNSSVSVGLGLAIPDSVSDKHYLYASGYSSDGQIEPTGFKNFSAGYWSTEGFKGGILPATNIKESQATTFFEEAIDQFKN